MLPGMTATCTVPGCAKPQRRPNSSRPWCDQHYQRWRLYGDPAEPSRWEQPKTCTVAGCAKPHYGKGLCVMHAARLRRHGDLTTVRKRVGIINRTTVQGYVMLKRRDHPHCTKAGWVYEHRLVMEGVLGRYLLPTEEVHHRNGQRADNRPENLELWVVKQPRGQRVEDMVAWAREILALYAPEGQVDDGEPAAPAGGAFD